VDDTICRIDDSGPFAVVRPQSVAGLGDVVRRAAAEQQALYPVGGGTMLGFGLPPSRPGWAVDLRSLNAVIDYPARDMTITVQAGIPIAELRRVLAAENQRLPVDVPHADQATLGGALATNVSGPRRYGSGTLRDYVLGLSTVNDEGLEVKAGGRVVKNVAGYDLCKLHIGALGTLGVITQATLKVRPIPDSCALVTLGCGAEGLEALLERLHNSRTRPGCLDVLNMEAAGAVAQAANVALPEAAWVAIVGYEDSADAANWQVRQLMQDVLPAGVRGLEARAGGACRSLWQSLAESVDPPHARLSFKANVLSGAVASFCLLAAGLSAGIRLYAHAGSGIVYGHFSSDLTLERVQEMLKGLQDAAEAAQGNLILPRCPPEWKRSLPIWGRPRGDAWLMREVKAKFDPRGLFNPGRFIDGI
jgi:glycolate dehydrogenase FAD-binding subunit